MDKEKNISTNISSVWDRFCRVLFKCLGTSSNKKLRNDRRTQLSSEKYSSTFVLKHSAKFDMRRNENNDNNYEGRTVNLQKNNYVKVVIEKGEKRGGRYNKFRAPTPFHPPYCLEEMSMGDAKVSQDQKELNRNVQSPSSADDVFSWLEKIEYHFEELEKLNRKRALLVGRRNTTKVGSELNSGLSKTLLSKESVSCHSPDVSFESPEVCPSPDMIRYFLTEIKKYFRKHKLADIKNILKVDSELLTSLPSGQPGLEVSVESPEVSSPDMIGYTLAEMKKLSISDERADKNNSVDSELSSSYKKSSHSGKSRMSTSLSSGMTSLPERQESIENENDVKLCASNISDQQQAKLTQVYETSSDRKKFIYNEMCRILKYNA